MAYKANVQSKFQINWRKYELIFFQLSLAGVWFEKNIDGSASFENDFLSEFISSFDSAPGYF